MTEHQPLTNAPLPVRLRTGDYLLLDREGAFEGYGKTELIEGDIYYMNAQHRPHALAKMELYDALRDALRQMDSPLRPLVEASIALSDHDVPEPDLLLTSEPKGKGLVPLKSVALVIEVSDSTLETDLGRKADIYAEAGVPEYWVVDLNENRVLMHANPRGDGSGYDGQLDVLFGETLHSATIEGLEVETTGLV